MTNPPTSTSLALRDLAGVCWVNGHDVSASTFCSASGDELVGGRSEGVHRHRPVRRHAAFVEASVLGR
jgi:hypothetical protein